MGSSHEGTWSLGLVPMCVLTLKEQEHDCTPLVTVSMAGTVMLACVVL